MQSQSQSLSSCVRGYAANNSRALFRRRSSTTDYVGMGAGGGDIQVTKVQTVVKHQAVLVILLQHFENVMENDVIENDEEGNDNICYEAIDENNEDYLDMNCGNK